MLLQEFDIGSLKSGEVCDINTKSFNKLSQWIKEYCSEYLIIVKEEGGDLLFRGFQGMIEDIFIGKSREDRRPIANWDIDNIEYAKRCDQLLTIAGFKATRGNSIFCTSNIRIAQRWGTAYVIFPINGFSFGYSRLYTNTTCMEYLYPSEEKVKKNPEECANWFVKENEITNNNLKWALEQGQDVWINCSYIAIKLSYWEQIKNKLNLLNE